LEKKWEKTIQLDASIRLGGPRSENNSGGSDISPEGARASQPYRCILLNGFFTLFLQKTRRLEECNNKSKKETVGTFKKVLTVNQVFDIILTWYRSKDWVKAISAGLPERTGLVPIQQITSTL
jgi:hypothetical protein